MAVTMKQMALFVSLFGVVSFILGVIAENKKPASGTPVAVKGGVSCMFPSAPTVALGYLSIVFLIASTVVGYLSLFYPYKGKSVPQGVLFRHTTFLVFFNAALFTSGLAATLLLWPVIQEQIHRSRRVHLDADYACPTAKTGLIGGGAFLSLDSCLLWLVALMLADNVREDHFDDGKGEREASSAFEHVYDAGIVI